MVCTKLASTRFPQFNFRCSLIAFTEIYRFKHFKFKFSRFSGQFFAEYRYHFKSFLEYFVRFSEALMTFFLNRPHFFEFYPLLSILLIKLIMLCKYFLYRDSVNQYDVKLLSTNCLFSLFWGRSDRGGRWARRKYLEIARNGRRHFLLL